jgi:thiol-disulfide isomerase/thioredoxin
MRAAAAAAVLGVLLVTGCSAGRLSGDGQRGGTASSPAIGTTIFRAGTGPRAAAVSGPLLGGGRLSLAVERGHVVVLNFWGSWCSVCREEAPALAATARRFQARGVRFVGVDVADDSASAKAFLRHFGIRYPSMSDPGDSIAVKFGRLIPTMAFPSTVVIAANGSIAARVIGAVTYPELARLIQGAEGDR